MDHFYIVGDKALDIPLPDAAVFTKNELESMKEDVAAEEEETFIANNVEELAASLAEVLAAYRICKYRRHGGIKI